MQEMWDEYFARAVSDITKAMPTADAREIVRRASLIANAAVNASPTLRSEPIVYLARIIGHLVAKPDGESTEHALRSAVMDWTLNNFDAAIVAAIDHNELERDGDKFVTPMPF